MGTGVVRLFRDQSGNFGLMTALIFPVVAATAGVSLDFARAIQLKQALQSSADAAVLSTANALAKNNALTDGAAAELAQRFMKEQFFNVVGADRADNEGAQEEAAQDPLATQVGNIERKTSSAGKSFGVTIHATYALPTNGMTALLGFKDIKVSVEAAAEATSERKNAFSMYMVLDRSGSMGEDTSTINPAQPTKCGDSKCSYRVNNYIKKMDALKLAVASLADQFNAADKEKKLIRTAAVSYNSSMQSPVSFNWGSAHSVSYVQALTATGGTESSTAMARAHSDLMKSTEDSAHKNLNGQIPTRFILFMTDGDNNNSSSDTKTKATCDKAKAEGVQIFTVAFMAPKKGRALLEYCATSPSHYYDAQNAAQLVSAFKEISDKAVEASTRLTN